MEIHLSINLHYTYARYDLERCVAFFDHIKGFYYSSMYRLKRGRYILIGPSTSFLTLQESSLNDQKNKQTISAR